MAKLFVYALLKHNYEPPKYSSYEKDAIHGKLYDVGKDGFLTSIGDKDNLVVGDVLDIKENEFKNIDYEEHPDFKRVTVTTLRGTKAQVYLHTGKLPKNAELVTEWFQKRNSNSSKD